MRTKSTFFKTTAILSTALFSLLGGCLVEDQVDYTTDYGSSSTTATQSDTGSTTADTGNTTTDTEAEEETSPNNEGPVFVAVGYDGATAYSDDGSNWTVGDSGVGNQSGVGYFNGKFVSVARQGGTCALGYCGNPYAKSAYSTDGIIWTNNNSQFPEYGAGVGALNSKVANGKLFAVGDNGYVNISENGVDWTQVFITSTAIKDIAWGNGRYVVVTNTDFAHSDEDFPTNWNVFTHVNTNWNAIEFGNGVFVAFRTDADKMSYSYDGINWTQNTHDYGSISSVIFDGTKFIAVGYSSIISSTDGINWTEAHYIDISPSGMSDIVFDDDNTFNSYVTVGSVYNSTFGVSYNSFLYSADGLNWLAAANPPSHEDPNLSNYYVNFSSITAK